MEYKLERKLQKTNYGTYFIYLPKMFVDAQKMQKGDIVILTFDEKMLKIERLKMDE